MKFGQKIFLIAFVLVIISINIIGVMMINNSYKTSVELQIDKGILQINTLIENLSLYNNSTIILKMANQYLKNNINIEMYIDNTIVYTNFDKEYSNIKSKLNGDSKDINIYFDNESLFMKLNKNNYSIITKTDISEIYKIKEQQISFFTIISLSCSFIISFILSVGVFFTTKKIKILNNASKEIIKGNYEIAVKKLGEDEIGDLGRTFNQMSSAIDENINEITKVSEDRKIFINNLTHEIRTPLTSIIGYSSLIKNKKVMEAQKIVEYSEKIYAEGNYIKEISDKLMYISLLDSKQISLEKVNLSEELFKICQVLKDTFEYVKFEINIIENIYINSDKDLLKSLISNLVKNSISSYSENPFVRIELDKNGLIKITDNGKGIPEKELERIKEPFYTLNENRNRELSGMGLGLPLCLKIIKIHNGNITLDSKEGSGTQISIKLGEVYE